MNNPSKPFSAACERNRDPILGILRQHLGGDERVLEIGSGTGQHAVYFASAMPGITWQTSDRAENLEGIQAWIEEARLSNTPAPILLDVTHAWPGGPFDIVYTANTCHIMAWHEVIALFDGVSALLGEGGQFILYGPFNQQGRFTSPSNAAFDASLRRLSPRMGIRDLEDIEGLGSERGLKLRAQHTMPANNFCLVFGSHVSGT